MSQADPLHPVVRDAMELRVHADTRDARVMFALGAATHELSGPSLRDRAVLHSRPLHAARLEPVCPAGQVLRRLWQGRAFPRRA